jgi:Starch-binding associating with outer membrane
MKRNFKIFVACAASATALATTSCDKFIDVNENPNNALTTPAYTILANSLKVTGDNVGANFNGYAMWAAGYWGKSSIVNGYNEERTLNYNTLYQQALFNSTYDNLADYDQIIKIASTEGTGNLAAIAKIMKVYNYQLLVDEYGDVPYSQSLQGLGNIKPQYDRAEDIYKDLVLKLDEAVTEIAALPTDIRAVGSEDVVFGGSMANWTRFAQTLKLRLLMRMSTAAEEGGNTGLKSFITAEFAKYPAAVAFVTADVVVQPGFVQSSGKQNPFFDRYGITSAGGNATERNYVQPTNYILAQYSNGKDGRRARLYTPRADGTFVGVNLGDPTPPALSSNSRNRVPNGGLLKNYDMPQPLMLNAESQFLQAEAKLRGYLTGGDAAAKVNYDNGVAASFTYFYTAEPSRRGLVSDSTSRATPAYNRYVASNIGNPLVDWNASGTVTKYQKIYFQKYLALNGALPIEAWSEIRRTDYPRVAASLQSTSPRADKLAVRLLYPQTEVATNGANIPTVNQFTSRIFWDIN